MRRERGGDGKKVGTSPSYGQGRKESPLPPDRKRGECPPLRFPTGNGKVVDYTSREMVDHRGGRGRPITRSTPIPSLPFFQGKMSLLSSLGHGKERKGKPEHRWTTYFSRRRRRLGIALLFCWVKGEGGRKELWSAILLCTTQCKKRAGDEPTVLREKRGGRRCHLCHSPRSERGERERGHPNDAAPSPLS